MLGGRLRIVECVREAQALNGRLRNALDARWGFDTQCLENRRQQINGVGVLRAHFTLRFNAFGPVNNQWIADTASVGFALPTAERRIARPRPAPGVVVTNFRTAKLVQSGQILFERSLHVVEEQRPR